jgi:hypothetical protein
MLPELAGLVISPALRDPAVWQTVTMRDNR